MAMIEATCEFVGITDKLVKHLVGAKASVKTKTPAGMTMVLNVDDAELEQLDMILEQRGFMRTIPAS